MVLAELGGDSRSGRLRQRFGLGWGFWWLGWGFWWLGLGRSMQRFLKEKPFESPYSDDLGYYAEKRWFAQPLLEAMDSNLLMLVFVLAMPVLCMVVASMILLQLFQPNLRLIRSDFPTKIFWIMFAIPTLTFISFFGIVFGGLFLVELILNIVQGNWDGFLSTLSKHATLGFFGLYLSFWMLSSARLAWLESRRAGRPMIETMNRIMNEKYLFRR
jgi:hypothetical protein